MYQLQFEFTFRIKGSYFYSAELLLEENILFKNQLLNITPEPNNPFDSNALQIWLNGQQLKSQFISTWHSVFAQGKLSQGYQQPAHYLSTKLSTTFVVRNHPLPNTQGWLREEPYNLKFANYHWQYRQPQWLLGYVPKSLSALLSAKLYNPRCHLWRIDSAPSKRLYAKLRLHLPIFSAFKLAWQLLQQRKTHDFQYQIKFTQDSHRSVKNDS